MSKGLQNLRSRIGNRNYQAAATPLYRWLTMNQEEIRSTFAGSRINWSEILQAAREDGIDVEDSAEQRLACRKKWHRVLALSAQREAKTGADVPMPSKDRSSYPSRQSKNWTPEPEIIGDAVGDNDTTGSAGPPDVTTGVRQTEEPKLSEKKEIAVADNGPNMNLDPSTATAEERKAYAAEMTRRALEQTRNLARKGGGFY